MGRSPLPKALICHPEGWFCGLFLEALVALLPSCNGTNPVRTPGPLGSAPVSLREL